MRGSAMGAEVPFEHIALLQVRTKFLKLAERPYLRARLAENAPIGCTGVVVMPGATAEQRLIHAQNWDWKADDAETAVVPRIRRSDGPNILTLTEAGGLARSGLNASGIGLTAYDLQSDRNYCQVRVPLALIRRKMLERETPALAMRAVYLTQKSAANNMIVSASNAAGQGVAINFECAPDETFQVHPERGRLTQANHFMSPVALMKLRDIGVATTPGSLYRDLRVHDLFLPHVGDVIIDHVKAALFDNFGSPFSVCRPPRLIDVNNLTASVEMIVMEPALGVMDVAMPPGTEPPLQPVQSHGRPTCPVARSRIAN